MLKIRLLAFVLFFAFAGISVAMAHGEIPGAPQKKPIALRNAKVYTITQGIVQNCTVVFDNGRITAIGQQVQIPADAEIIDCNGKSVYPGFISPDSDLGLVEIEAVRSTRDAAETGTFNPNAKAVVAYNPDSEVIPTIRSNGVLLANIMPGGGLIAGKSAVMQLDGWNREDIALKAISGLVVNIPNMGTYSAPWMSKSAEEQRKDNENALLALHDYFSKAKMYALAAKQNLNRNAIDIRYESMLEVFDKKMPVILNAGSRAQIIAAIQFAKKFELKAIISGAYDAHLCTDELKSADIPVIIPRTHSLPSGDENGYDEPFILPGILEKAGILWAFSESSFWQQRNLPFNAGTAMAFGLTEESALRALTMNPARIFGIADKVGSLEIGKDATLFVSKGNALDALTNDVEYAFIQGRKVSLENKQSQLARKYRTRFKQQK